MKYTFKNTDKEVTITDFEVAGINHWDYPDYCDAFLDSAKVDGREATQAELDELQQDDDLVYDVLMDAIELY
jgi:hypothetical protein